MAKAERNRKAQGKRGGGGGGGGKKGDDGASINRN